MRDVARELVAGGDVHDALPIARDLVSQGLAVTVSSLTASDPAGAPPERAESVRDEYRRLLGALWDAELTPDAEVSVKLSALGQAHDAEFAYRAAHEICARATECGTTVTLDAEEYAATDATLDALQRLRVDFPTTGVTLQSQFRRTEADCRELTAAGVRVRLCRGERPEPEAFAFQPRLEIDRSYVRCLKILLAGDGYAMVATADPRLIAIAEDRARWFERTADEFEFQLRHGVRPDEQRRLAAAGYTVRVYLPYGARWYPYLIHRLVERPAGLAHLVRTRRLPR